MKKHQSLFVGRIWRYAFILMALFALQGCGGGGGGSSSGSGSSGTTTTPAIDAGVGYFDNGTADVFSDNANTTAVHITDLKAIVKGNQLMLVSAAQNVVWFADITSLNGTSYTANVRVYKDNVPAGTATLSGTLTSGSALSGTLTGQAYGSGTFSLVYSTDNNTTANVANIVRVAPTAVWINSNTSSFSTFFVDSTGMVTNNFGGAGGSTTFDSCNISGTVQAISNSALYQMSITLSSCSTASVDGTYSGYLTTTTVSSKDTIILMLENSAHEYSMYGDFQ